MLSEYSHSKPTQSKQRWCFTVKSEPIQLRELLDACHPAPQLQLLDVFRTDGRSGAQIFSDPSFFEREWESVVRKERGERVARRQTRKHRHPTEEAFPVSESDVVAQSTLETKANHGEHLPDRENFLPLEIVSPITPTSSSPPPPPPPPAPLLPIPSVIVTRSTYFTEPEVSRNDTREGNELVDTESFVPDDDGRDGKAKEELEPNLRIHRLLNEIRFFKSKQVLRQTATVPHPAITGTGNPRHDITEILKRRAALEMSDDSSLMSESDDAEWS